MNKIRHLIFSIFFLTLTNVFIFSENINFFSRTFFSNSQFWLQERSNIEDNNDDNNKRNIYTNFFSGGAGAGMEFIIWDMGKAKGSRLFFKTGADFVLSGLSYSGGFYYDTLDHTMFQINTNGGAMFTGIDWDFFLGGSFPKTDLLWGFGCIYNFLFPSYSPKYNVSNFNQKWYFYAVPAIMLGYDITIPKTNFKITPQIRAGFTCNPVIPRELYANNNSNEFSTYNNRYAQTLQSGPYFDFSIAFTFTSVKWKE
jgi:hypothetical protein